MQCVITNPKTNLETRATRLSNCFLAQGFLYLKIELEANVEPEDYDRESDCESCSGSGRQSCDSCEGTGTYEMDCTTCKGQGVLTGTDPAASRPCPDCEQGVRESDCGDCSNGQVSCGVCDGRGYFDGDDWIDGFHDNFLSAFREKLGDTKDCLKYLGIYKDGSVDTEVTLTLRVNYIKELPEIISAFAKTCKAFGSCDTGNAGLHITLLPGYKYPRTEKLDERKLANFKRNVNKLLLGLICMGSNGETTRAFEYRELEISSTVKYSAIYTHQDTCLEYRLFDACCESPLTILRYLELIRKTLHYYTDQPRRILKLKANLPIPKTNEILNKKYFGHYRRLAEVFETEESIQRLFTELTYLVRERSKKWLTETYRAYTEGILTRAQLFSLLVAQVREG